MNTQQVLDWRVVHGSRYRYQDLQEATGLSRKQLYRMRATTKFGKFGLFTYGESLAVVFAYRTRLNYREHVTVLQDLAWKIDHATVDDFTACIAEHDDGTWTAHVGRDDKPHNIPALTITSHLPTLALALANAHVRLDDGTREHARTTAGLT